MEKIMDEYGRFALDLLAMGLLLAYLFGTVTDAEGHRGILKIMGAQIAVWDTDYTAYQDYDVYEAEAQKDKPVIEYIADKPMTLGDNRVADYIAASAWDGAELPFLIIKVEDWRGTEVDLNGVYNEADYSLNFLNPGIYKVRVVASDAGNRKTECDISIPVSR